MIRGDLILGRLIAMRVCYALRYASELVKWKQSCLGFIEAVHQW